MNEWSDFVLSLQRLYRRGLVKQPKLDKLLQDGTINGDEYLFITSGKEV